MTVIGNLFVIAAPSGTGKTSLVNALTDVLTSLTVSISHTTRPKRGNEKNGVNYYFVDTLAFKRLIEKNAFLEYAAIFDHYYGTRKQDVIETLKKGIDVILEIDWQGYQQVKRLYPETIGIFILPPSLQDLKERLTKRNQDHPDIIQKRLHDAKLATSHIYEFQYVVVNDDFASALADLKKIIEANRLLQKRQCMKFSKLIKDLSTTT